MKKKAGWKPKTHFFKAAAVKGSSRNEPAPPAVVEESSSDPNTPPHGDRSASVRHLKEIKEETATPREQNESISLPNSSTPLREDVRSSPNVERDNSQQRVFEEGHQYSDPWSKQETRNLTSWRIEHGVHPEIRTHASPVIAVGAFSAREKVSTKVQRFLTDVVEQCKELNNMATVEIVSDLLENAMRELEHLKVEIKYAARRPIPRGPAVAPSTKMEETTVSVAAPITRRATTPIRSPTEVTLKKCPNTPPRYLLQSPDSFPTYHPKKQTTDERLRQAEERRHHASIERSLKNQEAQERQVNAKARKEVAADKIRVATEEKQEKAAAQHDAHIQAVRDVAAEQNAKAVEIAFIQKTRDLTKRLEFEQTVKERDTKLERMREEQQSHHKEREESYKTVLGRRREIDATRQEAIERKQRLRDEKLALREERRQQELESARQKAEEQSKKVREAQQNIQEEHEQRAERLERRGEAANEAREALREAKAQKFEENKKKAQETRERKDAYQHLEVKRSLHDVLVHIEGDSFVNSFSLKKANAWLDNTAKTFLQQYVCENGKTTLRAVVQKLQSLVSSNKPIQQVRSTLHELTQRPTWTSGDRALCRDVNLYSTLTRLMTDDTTDVVTFRLSSTLLYLILKDTDAKGVEFFVRSGTFLQCLRFVMQQLRDASVDFDVISPLFSSVQCGISYVMSNATHEMREKFGIIFDAGGVTKLCTALTKYTPIPLSPYAAEAVYNALCITAATLQNRTTDECLAAITHDVISLLGNILLHPTQEELQRVLTEDSRVPCVCYVAFRVLNMACDSHAEIARQCCMRSIHEISHVLAGLLQWACDPSTAETYFEDPSLVLTSVPRTDETRSIKCLRSLIHEMLLFMGNLAKDVSDVQNAFLWRQPPLLVHLCNLPVEYFTEPLNHVLLPVLITLTHGNDDCTKVLGSDISLTNLVKYLTEHCQKVPRGSTLLRGYAESWSSEAIAFYTKPKKEENPLI